MELDQSDFTLLDHTADLGMEIKAITYHQIAVIRKKDRWAARIIFDL
ncbi:MAG: archease [Deltaproteobacteria bacterium]|nr:archease [Deltaproteobacteria bacterium]